MYIIYTAKDCRLNWKKHMFTERKQLGFQLGKMYWLLDSKSQQVAIIQGNSEICEPMASNCEAQPSIEI